MRLLQWLCFIDVWWVSSVLLHSPSHLKREYFLKNNFRIFACTICYNFHVFQFHVKNLPLASIGLDPIKRFTEGTSGMYCPCLSLFQAAYCSENPFRGSGKPRVHGGKECCSDEGSSVNICLLPQPAVHASERRGRFSPFLSVTPVAQSVDHFVCMDFHEGFSQQTARRR